MWTWLSWFWRSSIVTVVPTSTVGFAPPCFCRFFLSFRRGLLHVYIVSVGKWAGVETPIATGMLSIGSAILERDLYVEGRTLENLGLADLSREQMHTLLHKGFC